MEYKVKYQQWLDSPSVDGQTKKELEGIAGDEKEIEDRFYKNLEFGTGGLRGVMGAGSNRMNHYTVGIATQGFANYIKKHGEKAMDRGVVIAYDSRHLSPEFAKRAALVLNGNGIRAFLFSQLQPTPILSFAVRELKAIAGIVITASHNPPEYNGYKAYWEDGAQLDLTRANEVIDQVDKVGGFENVLAMPEEEALKDGLLKIIRDQVTEKYQKRIEGIIKRPSILEKMGGELNIIYTPLHGAGNKPVREALRRAGFKNVRVVPQQELPDSQFSTVGYPNPEDPKVFKLAIEMAKADGNRADIIIGTDPDCDRVGLVVKNAAQDYVMLTGNQVGSLLTEYILSSLAEANKIPSRGTIIKTVVTGKMAEKIAHAYGVEVVDTLTGFKFIGGKIKEFKETGSHTFIFGYEESYGYLPIDFVRDKDGISSSLLICEMAAYYKSRGMGLYEGLLELWDKYGYFFEEINSVEMTGREGMEKINKLMEGLRNNPPKEFVGNEVILIEDYMVGRGYDLKSGASTKIDLPKSNVLRFTLEDESWFAIRPSGTEPKVKTYVCSVGHSLKEGEEKVARLSQAVSTLIN